MPYITVSSKVMHLRVRAERVTFMRNIPGRHNSSALTSANWPPSGATTIFRLVSVAAQARQAMLLLRYHIIRKN